MFTGGIVGAVRRIDRNGRRGCVILPRRLKQSRRLKPPRYELAVAAAEAAALQANLVATL
jgi:hypothetical protein